MKQFILAITVLLILSACNQQKKSETLTKEQQEFCINTFNLYLDVDNNHVEESLRFIKLLQKHMEGYEEDAQEYFQQNIIHIDSVMHHCIELVKQEDYKTLIDILENERMNIVAHPNNTVDNEWQLHSVFALLYAQYIDDDKEYYSKLAELGEWSRMHIEAVQANSGKPHPLYKQVLNELLQIYDTLDYQDKKVEIEKRYIENDISNFLNSVKGHEEKDIIVGNFTGNGIDTLTIQPLSKENTYIITGLNAQIPALKITNNICPALVFEGDLDGNGQDEFGILDTWMTSTCRMYRIYTLQDGKWKYLIPPIETSLNLRSSGLELAEPCSIKNKVRIRYSDLNAPLSSCANATIKDTIISVKCLPIE